MLYIELSSFLYLFGEDESYFCFMMLRIQFFEIEKFWLLYITFHAWYKINF